MIRRRLVLPYAGAAAELVAVLNPALDPLVSWMGGKRRWAPTTLRMVGIAPGSRCDVTMNDLSWWGWVWAVVLDRKEGPRVSEVLRSWRGEDPVELWYRLRGLGPETEDVAVAAAQLLWLQARAASGVPVWWANGSRWRRTSLGTSWRYVVPVDGPTTGLVSMDGHGRGPYAAGCKGPALVQWASSKVDEAGQRQATEPKLLSMDGRNVPRETGHNGRDSKGGGGIVDPGTIAHRADRLRAAAAHARISVYTADAERFSEILSRDLSSDSPVILDPPYKGKTGYPERSPRDQVLRIADLWATTGPRRPILLHEAVGLAAELGSSWRQEQLAEGEWVTYRNCNEDCLPAPLLRLARAR